MALCNRRVWDIRNASFFVCPVSHRRQLTVMCMDVHRLGDDDSKANIVVVPVPKSAVRDVEVVDSSAYKTLFSDLEGSFRHSKMADVQVRDPKDREYDDMKIVFFGASATKHRHRVYKTLSDLSHARMDGLSLNVSKRVRRLLESHYNDMQFSYLVLVYRQTHVVTRIHAAWTHPLMRRRLFVPLTVFCPRGVPEGEHPAICVDERPEWKDRLSCVYSCNTGADAGVSVESLQQQAADQDCVFGSPFVHTSLPAQLEGNVPLVVRRAFVHSWRSDSVSPCPELQDLWLSISSIMLAVTRANAARDCGSVLKGLQELRMLVEKKPDNSVAKACYGSLCATHGDYQEAMRQFLEASRLNPHSSLVPAMLAWSIVDVDVLRAQKAFQKALELDPYDAASLLGLAACKAQQDGVHGAESLLLLRRAQALAPNHTEPKLKLEAASAASASAPFGLTAQRRERVHEHEHDERQEARAHLDAYFESFLLVNGK